MAAAVRRVDLSPSAIAQLIALDVRELALATMPGCGGFHWPSDVDCTVASLQLAAARLPQTLAQSEQWLADAMEAGRVGHDAGVSARDAVDGACKWLSTALVDASALARSLDVVRQHTSHLTGILPAGGER